jgi:hypothetical protein
MNGSYLVMILGAKLVLGAIMTFHGNDGGIKSPPACQRLSTIITAYNKIP